MTEPLYPESEKLHAVSKERDAVAEFLEWAENQGMILCSVQGRGYQPVVRNTDALILEMWDIDPAKLEQERRDMLEAFTKENHFHG